MFCYCSSHHTGNFTTVKTSDGNEKQWESDRLSLNPTLPGLTVSGIIRLLYGFMSVQITFYYANFKFWFSELITGNPNACRTIKFLNWSCFFTTSPVLMMRKTKMQRCQTICSRSHSWFLIALENWPSTYVPLVTKQF